MGNELRRNVNSALITDLVKETESTIRANSRLIDSYTKRLNALLAKRPKDDDDRAEMLSLTGLVSGLRSENIRLEQGSREWVRNRLTWTERPRLPELTSNRAPYWTLLALVVGGMLGAGIAFVLEYLRHADRVRNTRDLEGVTGLPALATVTEKRGDLRAGPAERLVMLRYPGSEVADAYRGLLTKIGFAAGSARSLMVASPDASGIGSIVAANIALAYAEAGRTVILVDADFRSPRLHSLFGVANDRGLTNLLAFRDMPLAFVTTATSHPKLGLMPAGPPPSATAEALELPFLNALMRRLLHAADVVVFASPSTADSLDATVLAGSAEESVLVVPAGARAADIVEAAAALERARVHFTGAVLYRQVRGSHPRRAAVSLRPPANRWVPKAEPASSAPRLPAVASGEVPAPGAPPGPPRGDLASQPEAQASTSVKDQPVPEAPPHVARQDQPPPRPMTSSPPLAQTVPSTPGPPLGPQNGRGTAGPPNPNSGPTAAAPRPVQAGPYSARFDPNATRSTSAASKS